MTIRILSLRHNFLSFIVNPKYMFSIEKATLADCPLIQTLASNIWEPTYGSTFIVEASGDSMIDAGISDGDMLIFDRDAQPRGGDIVLALYDGNITVKRLRIVDGRPELHPENAAARYKVICPKSTEQFEIEGVLRGLCRRYS